VPLDEAPNAFDDQYLKCQSKMWDKVENLNKLEPTSNSVFATAWAKAADSWNKPLEHLKRQEQAIALRAYTLKTDLYKEFNAAVRTAGSSHLEDLSNPFKVMHFLLTTALQDLRRAKTHPKCFDVFRGVRGIRFTAKPGDIVRFGQFASSSLNRKVARGFGTDTFFKLKTCHGADISYFSKFPEQQEVLIPPFETFSVTSVTHKWTKTHIQLDSNGNRSHYKCGSFSGDIPGVGTPVA
ncbi:NARE ribosyltransferase, partial [Onychorhynchus coronatus]|nr:NARE ribosyltransferase [Onychorhynchus coronatus]